MVYVDNMQAPFRSMVMCHMMADTQQELLDMADKIGVNKKWIQYPDTYKEHFDISSGKRVLAIKNGAIEVSMTELGKYIHARMRNEAYTPLPLSGQKPLF